MKLALQLQGLRVGDSVGTEAQPGNHQVTIHLSTLCRPPRPGAARVRAPQAGSKWQIGGKSA